jgi:hypothetical protein
VARAIVASVLLLAGATAGHAATVFARVVDLERGTPLAGAVVTVTGSDLMAVTGADGGCVIPLRLKSGTLTAGLAGYITGAVAVAKPAVRSRDSILYVIPLYPDLPRVVKVLALDSVSNLPLGDANAFVSVTGESAAAGIGGLFFSRFPPGEQSIEVSADGCVSVTRNVIARGGETTRVSFLLRDTADVGAVAGTVVDAVTGTAVSGARLALQWGVVTAVSDSAGEFAVAGLAAGPHTLYATADGYAAQRIPFRVLKDWTVRVSFSLKRPGTK